jgi:subtilisin family serine protease
VGVAALAAGLATPAVAGDPPPPALCGVLPPVDRILHCHSQSPAPASAPAPAPSTTTTTTTTAAPQAAPATLQTTSVRTVSMRPAFVRGELLVHLRPGTRPAQAAALVRAQGGRVVRAIPHIGVLVVRVAPQRRDVLLHRIDRLAKVDAERDVVFHAFMTTPNDAHWSLQWGLRSMGLPAVWDRFKGSPRVVVAVLDTGVDASHPDLAGALLPSRNVVAGASAADEDGHGTAVAGVIAARPNNGQGEAGVCWSCRVLSIKVLRRDGDGTASDAATGIVQAVDRGARVINLSLGGPVGTQALADAVAYALKKGRVVVAAAGNQATTKPMFPAAYPGVVSVGGVTQTSSFYPWSDRGSWVRVSAPGCNVATQRGGGYEMFCGTSSAAPLVSGLAAIAIAAKPSATGAQITSALLRSGRPVNALGMLARLGIRIG